MINLDGEKTADVHVPLVSVVLPVYNGEQFLEEAIDSILAQSFTDFELIIIDDGSTDGSLAILRQYQNRDVRIRLIARENRNLATTLNELIDLARGNWIARMDQDDIAVPQRFERQLQWLQKTGADICGSWVQRFGAGDNRVLMLHQTDEAIKMDILFGSPFAHPSVMMRAILVKQLHYDKAWEKAEDYDLWERAARSGWHMTNVPEVLLMLRQHPTQISTKTFSHQQLLGQRIRRRYMEFVFNAMKIESRHIDEVLKLFEFPPTCPDMNVIDATFAALMQNSSSDVRQVIFERMTQLFFRIASVCPDIVSRWSALNRRYGRSFALGTKSKLWMLRILRAQPDGNLFNQLKKIYVHISR